MSFRFEALEAERFAPLFEKNDEELAALGARRVIVSEKPGYPCRVSLADAEVGETVLLLPFIHHEVETAYRGGGAIFVRRGFETARPAPGEIPAMFESRLLSVRAYDAEGMMVAADVADGPDLRRLILELFADERVAYLHVHNARPGCYDCRVVRA